ncbi:mucin-5AC-like [Harmonia axyridis]|uniref:mucin-5AC-like n=1 Tax=Harmonia axyridis TaxID=115357 RepID=UPI001E27563E|nr:mucin-5AC-like [Harmonia axyridis]
MRLAFSFLLLLIFSGINGEEEEQFICIKAGRYDNPSDDTCNSFYLCSFTLNGELIQTQYSCPEKSLFLPKSATCSKNYTCPRVSRATRDLVEIETINNVHYQCRTKIRGNYECKRSGKYADLTESSCRTYYLCSLLQSGKYMKTKYECPEGTLFDPSSQKCHTSYECPCQGQWPRNNENSNSNSYREEERREHIGWAERYQWTDLFERWTERYSWTEIPKERTTRKQSSTVQSTVWAGTDSCLEVKNLDVFKCQEEGTFPDKRDATCTDYFLCTKLSNGGFLRTKYSCPYGTTYNPHLQRCSFKYVCPCQIGTVSTYLTTIPSRATTRLPSTTTTTTEIVYSPTPLICDIPNEDFICHKKGRFPDRSDLSCNTYFHCEVDSKGFSRKRYRCPRCLTFDPSLEKCTDNYVCPCTFTEAPKKTSATTQYTSTAKLTGTTSGAGASSTSPSSDQTNGSKQTTENSMSSTQEGSSTTNDCIISPFSKPFRCSKKGRFADKRDLTCSSYFLCSELNNGTLIKTKYKCPKNSFFDPSIGRCSKKYDCPCSNIPASTTKNPSSSSGSTGKSSSSSSGKTINPTDVTKSTGQGSNGTSSTGRTKSSSSSKSTESSTTESGRSKSTTSSGGSSGTPSTGKTGTPSTGKTGTPSTGKTGTPSTGKTGTPSTGKTGTPSTGRTGTPSTEKTGTPSTGETGTPSTGKTGKPSKRTTGTPSTGRTGTPSTGKTGTPSTGKTGTPSTGKTGTPSTGKTGTPSTGKTGTPSTGKTGSPSTGKTGTPSTGKTGTPSTGKTGTPSTEKTSTPSTGRTGTPSTGRTGTPSTRNTGTPSTGKTGTPSTGKTGTPSTGKTGTPSTGKTGTPSTGKTGTPSTGKTGTPSTGKTGTPSTGRTGTPSTGKTGTPSTEKTGTPSTGKTKPTTENPMSSTQKGSSTTNDCIISPFSKPFRCSRKGRFANKRDLTCSSYFLCSELNNGTLIKTKYKCPKNSFFDPSIGRCSKKYDCPCSNIPASTTKNPSSTSSGSTGKSSPTSESTEHSTTESGRSKSTTSSGGSSGTPSTGKTGTPSTGKTGTPSTEKIGTPSTGKTGTPSTGKTGTPSTGKTGTPSTEKTGTPSTGKTGTPSTGKTGTPSTGKTGTPSTGNTGTPSTGKSGTPSTGKTKPTTENPMSSTQKGSSTTNDCIISPFSKPFRCSRKGRFANKRDLTCSSYFLCSELNNGTLIKTKYKCPKNSFFDPSIGRCSKKYDCPCSNIPASTTKNPSSTSSGSTGKSSSTSESTENSTTESGRSKSTTSSGGSSGTPSTGKTGTPSTGKTGTPSTGKTKPTTENPMSSTQKGSSTTNDCIISPFSRPFRCSRKGRFSNKRDLTCSSYFLCSELNNGTLIKTKYKCPKNSFFDPSIGRCSKKYDCPCSNIPASTTKNPSSTSSGSTGKSSSTSESTENSTTESGASKSTTSSGGSSGTPSTGKTGTPSTGKTKPTTENPMSSTQKGSSTTNDCIISPFSRPFRCSRKGRFSNKRDLTCSSYFLCSELNNGTLIKTKYKCPKNSFFDPSIGRCSKKYDCPCSNIPASTTKNPSSTSSGSTGKSSSTSESTENSTTESGTSKSTTSSGGSSSTPSTGKTGTPSTGKTKPTTENPMSSTQKGSSTTNDCIISPFSRPFRCSRKGRFSNKRDLTCSSYFLCSELNNGTLIKTKYKCPKNSFFDPSIGRCSKKYDCPCSNIPASTTKNPSSTSSGSTGKSSSTSESTENSTTESGTSKSTTSSGGSSGTPSTGKTGTPSTGKTGTPSTEKTGTPSTGKTGTPSTGKTGTPSTGKTGTPSTGKTGTTSTGKTGTPSTGKTGTTSTGKTGTPSTGKTKPTTENPMSSTQKGSSTTNDCIISPFSKPFRCSRKGRFANKRDLTCSSYFLCSELNNGTLIKTNYECPKNSFFDPSIERCSKKYDCPCSNKPASTTKNPSSTSSGSTGKSSSNSESTENSTTESGTSKSTTSSGGSSGTPSTGQTGTPSTEKTGTPSTGKTGTTSTGKTGTPSTGKTGTPSTGKTGTPSTGKTGTPSTGKTGTTSTGKTGTPSTGKTKPTTENPMSSTQKGSSTTNDCIISPFSKPFRCSRKGRFANKRDLTCSSYFLCSELNNGTLIKTKYKCPKNSLFDPSIGRCSKKYDCPCSNIPASTTKNPSSTSSGSTGKSSSTSESTEHSTTESGRSKSTTSSGGSSGTPSTGKTGTPSTGKTATPSTGKTGSPSTGKTGTPSTGKTGTPSTGKTGTPSTGKTGTPSTGKTGTPSTGKTKPTTENPMSSTQKGSSTTNDCIISPFSKPFRCSKKGRFANKRDPTCSSYFLCSELNNGTLIKTKYECPKNSFFDPSIGRCSKKYDCPCSNIPASTTKNPSSTSSGSTGKSSSTSESTENSTTESGRSKSTTSSGSSSGTPSTGKTGSPSTGKTKPTTENPMSSTQKGSSTTNDCIISPFSKPFRCSRKGRFANKRDLTCSSYFLCSELNNGTLIETKYKCPKNSFFDPSIGRCSKKYDCPCSNKPASTTKNPSSTSSGSTGKSSSTSESTENSTTESGRSKSTTSSGGSSGTPSTGKTGTPSTGKTDTPSTGKTGPPSTGKTGTPSTGKTGTPSTGKTGTPSTGKTGTPSTGKTGTPSTGKTGTPSTGKTKPTTENPMSSTQKGSSTTNDCIISPFSRPFRCSKKGRFANKRDLTCSSYFLCSELNNGTLIKTKYECPKNSFFDPSIGRCSKKYDCPCSNIPASTTKNPSSTSSGSTGKSSSTSESTENSTTESGRSKSTTSSGSSSGTPSTGKTGSPSTGKTGTPSTGKTGSPSTGKTGTPSTAKTGTPSTGKTEPTTENPMSSTQKGSSTTNDCIIPPSSKPFKCSKKGRFADKRDLTCSSYFLCAELNNSTFIKIHRRCPRNSFFDPSVSKCSEEYECPCSITSSTTPNASSSTPSNPTQQPTSSSSSEPTGPGCPNLLPNYKFVCEEKGRFPDLLDLSCSSYFLCTQLPDGTFVQAKYRCGNGLSFNPSTQTCSSFYKCPCSVTTSPTSSSQISSLSTKIPDFCQPTAEFVCTSVGRFPKPGDVSCCTYYSCSKSTNGTIIQTEFSCPEGSSFDPVFRTCSDSYTCPCHVTESPEYFSTSSDNCLIPTEEFVCSSGGRFPNRQDVSCCNYFLCSDLGNGTFIKTEYNCPKGKSFDPELKRCSSSYICPCSITENPETEAPTVPTTRSPTPEIITQPPGCDLSPLNPEHVCTSRGRFKDNKDITCSNYFLCSKLRNGTYIRTLYTCPRFSYFDPSIGMCTTTYKCPCISNFTTPTRSTGRITKIPGTRAPWHINTKKTTPATKPNECISVDPASGEIICSDEGKFLNPLDTKCTSYIHCVKKASVLVKTVVNCEGMTAFDVKLQKCSSNAVCILCT